MRHVVWTCTFACLLFTPAISYFAPPVKVKLSSRTALMLTAPPPVEAVSVARSVPAAAPLRHFEWRYLWLAGVVLMGLRLALAFVRLRRLRLLSRPVSWAAPSPHCVDLRESNDVALPITFGLLRPTILVPSSASNWPADRLRVVLDHELAHVRRFDCHTQLLAEAVCCVYWFHPLVWLAAAQYRMERERACDDAVLSRGTKSSDYAEHLLGVVRDAITKGAVAMAISIHSNDLQARLKAVLKPGINRRAVTPKLAMAIAALAVCIAVPIAVIRAQVPASLTAGAEGSVYDASHAVIPHAIIIATGLETHNKEVAYAGADGSFAFQSLPPGRYSVEVRAPGFGVFHQQVMLTPDQSLQLNPTMEIGSTTENIDVLAPRPEAAAGQAHGAPAPQRIRVGGNVQTIKLTYRVPPAYPEHAKENGAQGVVVLQGVVGIDGSLLSLETLSKSVDAELVQAARDAVSQWRYEPTSLNGEKVEVVTTITVNFKLQ